MIHKLRKLFALLTIGLLAITAAGAQLPVAEPEQLYNPFNMVELALVDLQGVVALNDPEIHPHHIRYIALNNIPKALRPKYKKTVDFVLNSLSRNRIVVRTAWADQGQTLIRANLFDYGIDLKDWDFLVEKGSGNVPLPDGYFHDRQFKYVDTTEEREQPVLGPDGKQIWDAKLNRHKTEKVKVKVKTETSILSTSAPWIAIEPNVGNRGNGIATLITACNTKNPLIRADWFIVYAGWAPAYYKLIGLDPDKGTEADIERLANADNVKAARSLIAAVTDTRLVTLHNRVLHRLPTLQGYTGGYIWRSNDTNRGIDEEDYLLNLHTFDKPKITAREIIFTTPNGLQAYAVVNDKGKLLNKADADIAVFGDDMPTRLRDKQVYTGLRSCAICHSGILPVDCRVRRLASGNIGLLVTNQFKDPRYKDLQPSKRADLSLRIREAFQIDVNRIVQHDDALYAASVEATNGLKAKENAAFFEEVVYTYLDVPITLEVAAREAGVQPRVLRQALTEGINMHYSLTGLLQNPPIPVSRLTWERNGYSALMLHLISYQPRQPAK